MNEACNTHVRDEKCLQILVGKPKGRLDAVRRIILRWILRKRGVKCRLDSCGLGLE